MTLLIAALFLPLFPLSAVLNLLLARLRAPSGAALVLLLWPQIGITLLQFAQPPGPTPTPAFIAGWALISAGFYALRLLTVRDLGLWAGFLASSALALTWLPFAQGAAPSELRLFAFWLGAPAAVLVLLIGPLTQRLGAAYAGLYAGFTGRLPRLAGVLTILVLSAIATPPFPGFFALLKLLQDLGVAATLGVLAIWLLWGWAATRVLQGFLSGPGRVVQAADLGRGGALAYAAALGGFAIAGLYVAGGAL